MKKLLMLPLLCLMSYSAAPAVSEAAPHLYARVPHARAIVAAPAPVVGVSVRALAPAPITIQSPEMVVIPSGSSYVYMMPNIAGVYFHGGYWYRYHGNRWFQATVYNGPWTLIKTVPAAVVAIDPLYTYYLPASYYRISITVFQENWSAWEQARTWDTHEWFVNEAKSEVRTARVNSIRADRAKGIDRSKVAVDIKPEAPAAAETIVAPTSVSVEIGVVAPARLEINEPDMVVIPGGETYIYMIPTVVGVYFYDGYWYRFHEGAWFRATVYNGEWIAIASAPAVVVAIDPYYPFYLPAGYHRIAYTDFHSHWSSWNHDHHWHNHSWFKHEMRHDVKESRLNNIKADRSKGIDPLKKNLQAKQETLKENKNSKDTKTKKVKKSAKKEQSGKSAKSAKSNKVNKGDQTAKSVKSSRGGKIKKSSKTAGKTRTEKTAKNIEKNSSVKDMKTTKADQSVKSGQTVNAGHFSKKSDAATKEKSLKADNDNTLKRGNKIKTDAIKSEKNLNAAKNDKSGKTGKETNNLKSGQTLKGAQAAKGAQTLKQTQNSGKIQANRSLQGSRNPGMQRQVQHRQSAPHKAAGFDRR